MFYNSKKLIDEKVLQQYFFERLMLADAQGLKKLIPEKYHRYYSKLSQVKGLQPEVLLNSPNTQGHKTDFVLYPMEQSAPNLNIEIKWTKSDFEAWRYPYYDGTCGEGFLVCLQDELSADNCVAGTQIPIIYLDIDEFKKWFALNAYSIVSQALSNKLSIPPERLTGHKYWVVVIGNKALEHYVNFGREAHVWAFRNNNSPKNIMNILEDDYIIFVNFAACRPGRKIIPQYMNPDKEVPTVRGGSVKSRDIDWTIGFTDIYKVKRGYHLNFGSKPLYSGFESVSWDQQAMTKEYTQFITLQNNQQSSDILQFSSMFDHQPKLSREHFPENSAELCEIVSAFSQSLNNRGDAIEVSYAAFQAFHQLLHS